MASVAPKVGRPLSFTKKVWNAFHEWYINACGYRQLGEFFSSLYAKLPSWMLTVNANVKINAKLNVAFLRTDVKCNQSTCDQLLH